MANKKKPTDEEIATEKEVDKSVELEKQIEVLKNQIAMMAQMMGNQQPVRPNTVSRTIPIYNMTKSTLILKGNVFHQFDHQFDMQGIPENEARQIVQNMPECTRNGSYYIADAQFVKENELSAVYETILNVEQMKNLLDRDSKYVIDVYLNASKGQKQIIEDMIVDRRLNGKEVDANVLMQLGKLSGKDFMGIEQMGE